MSGNASLYAARVRTQSDKATDCYLFIANATPKALLAMTAERLCDDKGVSNRQTRREVECRLLAAQAKERARS